MIIENQTILKADEGHYLTNGDTIATVVYLGKNDSAENWREITETDKEKIESENLKNTKTEV